jgi:Transposase zinc-binding domain
MERPALEVGDVFRRYGDAYRQLHAGSLSRAQFRVMSAIQRCRTAALGGHVEQCDQCHFQRIAYNSCLMESNLYWGVRSAWCQLLSD